ncbi:MAG: hypothetical protein NVS2B14_07320 [Chamaesiphon sp.]
MNHLSSTQNQQLKRRLTLLAAIAGSLLIGLPAIAQINSNPKSERRLPILPSSVPQVVTPSSDRFLPLLPNLLPQATPSDRLSLPLPSSILKTPVDIHSVSPPPPEQLGPPSAKVMPIKGKVNIKLENQTGTTINYEVLGETNQRTLQGRSYITLKDLTIPVNITFDRPDGGFIRISTQSDSEPGMLKVTLRETTNLTLDKKALTIQRNGEVFLN